MIKKIVCGIPSLAGRKTIFYFIFFLSFPISYSITFSQVEYYKDFQRTDEKEIKVKIESSFKKIVVLKGYPDKIVTVQYVSDDEESPDVNINYWVEGNTGILKIDLSDEGNDKMRRAWIKIPHRTPGLEPETWYIKLNNAIPIKLNMDIGAGNSNIDMSGLCLRDVRLSTGASNTSIICTEPNPVMMDNLIIEAGLAKFLGSGFGNANFKSMSFEGGVGSYSLDFNGTAMKKEANVRCEIGFGSLYISLPKRLGAQVRYDAGFLSSHSFEDFKEIGDGKYISGNYYESDGKIYFKIESGLGSVKIKRVDWK
jgi:hypothetical protein